MANLGDASLTFPSEAMKSSSSLYGIGNASASETISGTSSVPFAVVVLTRGAVVIERATADSSGVWNFYNLDDTQDWPYTAVSYLHGQPLLEQWQVFVTSGVAAVTKLAASIRSNGSVSSG